MGLVINAQSLAKASGFSVWHIKKKKVNPSGLGNLFNWHNGTIENSSVDDLRISFVKLLQSELPFTSSVSLLTRSLEVSRTCDNFCFHDNEWTSENGEEKKDLYSVEYSQMFACFLF